MTFNARPAYHRVISEQEKAFAVEHEAATRRLPDWVRLCWAEYSANPESYPFGFAYHFPDAWNWRG